jgi:fatty acyl-CoA reductase
LNSDPSSISDYYANKSILITGGTGYLGKVLIEKLLRSCDRLSTIYLLVRPKKGKKSSERLDEICDIKLFDLVRKQSPNFKEKLKIVDGDLMMPNLGLSDTNRQLLIENVNIVYNSAATIRFDEPLK